MKQHKIMRFTNMSSKPIFIGDEGVTTATGLAISPHSQFQICETCTGHKIFCVSEQPDVAIRTFELLVESEYCPMELDSNYLSDKCRIQGQH
jgi:hypothetical protein